MTRRFDKAWLVLKLGFYIAVPLALLILPADFFDDGPPLCLSVLLFQQECYACGTTRAIQHLIHFEFADAWYYNPIGVVAFPILAFLWASWFWKDWKRLSRLTREEKKP